MRIKLQSTPGEVSKEKRSVHEIKVQNIMYCKYILHTVFVWPVFMIIGTAFVKMF